ncbi:restriction endonuclease [Plantactinospora sonchi]|uniref:Restriction endonuclease n=1 Tax=Plantactinospora sonchi TaxID=1544735 RepID=A0ABU7S2Q5_9ACTN
MPRVSSYRRRDGTRVRGHYRTRRPAGARPRRTNARRRPAARATPDRSGWWLAGGLALLVALWQVTEFVRRHPIWSVVIVVGLLAVGGAVLTLVLRARDRRNAAENARALHIEVTDTMTGPQFEQWVAALLTRSGFSGVTVCGRAGDRGADIVATTPDDRRIVVQCKRHGPTNRVGSAAIQRFAGTCRSIHRGDICAIVTNGSFTAGDGLRLARELDIVLLDRTALAHWAYTGIPPASLRRG